MAFNTGGGATITFGQHGTFAARIIDGLRQSAPAVDASLLETKNKHPDGVQAGSTVCRRYMVPDLMDIDVVQVEILFDATVLPATFPRLSREDNVTITFPISVAGNNAATLVAPAWIQGITWPRFENNLEQTATFDLQFEQEAIFTAEATP